MQRVKEWPPALLIHDFPAYRLEFIPSAHQGQGTVYAKAPWQIQRCSKTCLQGAHSLAEGTASVLTSTVIKGTDHSATREVFLQNTRGQGE